MAADKTPAALMGQVTDKDPAVGLRAVVALRRLLDELTRAHLLAEHAPGRYAFHDLLRAYATEQAQAGDSDDARRATMHRVLDHYLHTAHAAVLLMHQHRDREPIALAAPQPGVVPEHVASHDGALAWFTAERPVLLAAIAQAATAGFDAQTWQLAWVFRTFLLRQGLWPEQVATHHTALAAARRLRDQIGQAHALHGLALGYSRWGRLDEAGTYFQRALYMFAELGDPAGQACACNGLAELAEMQGRPADALRYAQQTLDLRRAAGDRAGQASALNGVGWSHALLGDYPHALAYCTQALALLQELDDGYGQAATWDSLGYIHRGLADHQQAASCYQHAIDMYRALSDPYWEAGTLTNLGDTHHAAGHADAARRAWEQALGILDKLAHPDASRVRDMIDGLTAGTGSAAPGPGVLAVASLISD